MAPTIFLQQQASLSSSEFATNFYLNMLLPLLRSGIGFDAFACSLCFSLHHDFAVGERTMIPPLRQCFVSNFDSEGAWIQGTAKLREPCERATSNESGTSFGKRKFCALVRTDRSKQLGSVTGIALLCSIPILQRQTDGL